MDFDSISVRDTEEDKIAKAVVDTAFQIHKAFGPGLLEQFYEMVMFSSLSKRGYEVSRQHPIKVRFDEDVIDVAYRMDFLVCDKVIVEIKSVEKLIPIHEAQMLTYLKLSGKRLGLLINFNHTKIKDGIKRMVLRQNLGDLGVLGVSNLRAEAAI